MTKICLPIYLNKKKKSSRGKEASLTIGVAFPVPDEFCQTVFPTYRMAEGYLAGSDSQPFVKDLEKDCAKNQLGNGNGKDHPKIDYVEQQEITTSHHVFLQ